VLGAARNSLLTLCARWLIWCGAPVLRACNRLGHNALARLPAAKHESSCDAPQDCSGVAAGGVETHCLTAAEKHWVAEATQELAGRQLRAEVAQISGCLEKK